MDSNSRNNKVEIELVKLMILESATEDITGLYDVIWELNTKFPDIGKADKIEVAKIALMDLLNSGHLNLYKKSWTKNDQELLDKIHWTEIINQDKSWEPPADNGLYYCFLETQSTYEEAQKQYKKYKNKL